MLYLSADGRHPVRFTLNGRYVEGEAEPRLLLTDFLRHEIGATGTHVGCEHGVCGACTVRVDGLVVRACLVYAVQVDGCRVDTIEGMADGDELNDLQLAFQRHHALQCGFCTPGILMSLSQLVEEEPHADGSRVREVLSGHLCRCTGYYGMVAAVMEVLAARRKAKNV
ncbi:MAG: (2Fe-2S)-binding protein [Rhodospirillaceae bacterium]|nr:(2Fe-2S)-binding protein [Rhodospirillaceae bacterium]